MMSNWWWEMWLEGGDEETVCGYLKYLEKSYEGLLEPNKWVKIARHKAHREPTIKNLNKYANLIKENKNNEFKRRARYNPDTFEIVIEDEPVPDHEN